MHGDGHDFERWRACGDADALARVFDARAPALMRSAVHLVGDVNTAEDLVQETFLTALRKADRYDAARPIERWLGGILARHAMEVRREARRTDPRELPERAHEHTPLDDVRSAEERELVTRALDRLSEPYRSAAMLHFAHGLSAPEIAHVLERSPGAVRVQLHRARETLRQTLPVGIAGALALTVTSARGGLAGATGFEAMRAHVLQQAAVIVPAASGIGVVVGGAFLLKKVLAGAALVLALLLAAWWFVRAEEPLGRAATTVVVVEPTGLRAESSARLGVSSDASDVATRTTALEPRPGAEAAAHTFRCRVVDGVTDEPIAGARVRFYAPKKSLYSEVRARWPERFRSTAVGQDFVHDWPWFAAKPTAAQRLDLEPILSFEAPSPDEAPLAEGLTDANGEFESTTAESMAFVLAEADGYATRGVPPELVRQVNFTGTDHKSVQRTFRDDVLVVQLHRARRIVGAVVDTQGEPLLRRTVLRVEGVGPGDVLEGTWRSQRPVDSWTVVTDPEGRFTVDVAATRVSFRSLESGWYVASNGVHPVKKTKWSWGGTQTYDRPDDIAWVPLRRAPSIVVVSAADGQPIRDYFMQVRGSEFDAWPRGSLSHIHSEDGRAVFLDGQDIDGGGRSNPLSTLAIEVFAEGFVPAVTRVDDPRAAEDVLVRLEVGPCPVIRGRVVETRRPVSGANVLLSASTKATTLECDARGAGLAVRTDGDGRFAVPAGAGSWTITVEHGDRSQCRRVEVPSTVEVVIDLGLDTAIEVLVEGWDPRGGPTFAAISPASDFEGGASAELDDRGRAHFGSLAPGRYTVRVGGSGVFVATDSAGEFDLPLGAVHTVRFRSAAADPGRALRLVVDGTDDLTGWRACVASGRDWRTIEADGRFQLQFGSMPPGVNVASPDGQTFGFDAPLGVVGEVPLHLAARRGSYSGVVRRAEGGFEPGTRIAVTFRPDAGGLSSVETRTDANGRFRLDAVPQDARWLQILDSSGEASGMSVSFTCTSSPAIPPREIVIEVPVLAEGDEKAEGRISLTGRVTRGAVERSGLWLRALRDQSGGTLQIASSTIVGPDGSYHVKTLPAGGYEAIFSSGKPEDSVVRRFTISEGVTEFGQDFDLP